MGAQRDGGNTDAVTTATRALAAVSLLALSAGSTVLYGVAFLVVNVSPSATTRWIFECSVVLDVPLDVALALLCAGLIGPEGDREAELADMGRLAVVRRERLILEKLTEVLQASTGPALTFAGLFEGQRPETLVLQAVVRFRCISWDVLATMSDIVIGGGPLDQIGAGRSDQHTRSTPCRVGECDAFFSHSWHDDARQKWSALTHWCTAFEHTNQRSPRLWLDKVCIDQKNIEADLQCLPIFLAACNLFLAISGPTYTSRLWCCVELFVCVIMDMERDDRSEPVLITIGETNEEREDVRNSFRDFDAAACECFDAHDKTRILAVIARHPGGVNGFNQHVRIEAVNLFGGRKRVRNSVGPRPSRDSPNEVAQVSQGSEAFTNVLPGSLLA